MNHARFQSILRGLSSVCRKVFDAVPQNDAWHKAAIVAEMHRLGHGSITQKLVEGCLASLLDSGIVYEPNPGCFRRVKTPAPKAKEPKAEHTPTPVEQFCKQVPFMPAPTKAVAAPVAEAPSLTRRLELLAAQLRDVAEEVEEVALAVMEQSGDTAKELAKFAQLKALLKEG